MPYITTERREMIDAVGLPALRVWIQTADVGDLAYVVYALLLSFCDEHRFSRFASAVGAIREATAEFRRRVLWPYEDAKRSTEGDVT
jgi:hypothetical protein